MVLDRINEMTIEHYRGQADWYMAQTDGLGKLMFEMCLALEVDAHRTPSAGEPVVAGMWTRSAILERITELTTPPPSAGLPPPPRR